MMITFMRIKVSVQIDTAKRIFSTGICQEKLTNVFRIIQMLKIPLAYQHGQKKMQKDTAMNFDELSGYEVEIVGNKFDNPELLD